MDPGALAKVPCRRCRQRRVKCDKRQPGCTRCEKYSQPCPGYDLARKFLDETIHLKKRLSIGPHQEPETRANTTGSLSIVSTLPQPREGILPSADGVCHQGSEISSQGGPNRDIPSVSGGIISATEPRVNPTNNYFADVGSPEFDAAFFDIDPDVYYAQGNNCCGFIPNLPLIDDLSETSGRTVSWMDHITLENWTQSSSASPMPSSVTSQSEQSGDHPDKNDHEIPYLIRYFAETISPWMDTLDPEKYFGHVVPVRALRSTLLTNSVAALAAKQFGKVKKDTDSLDSPDPSYRILDMLYQASQVDWYYKAAGYYDKAICQMMAALQLLQLPGGPGDQNSHDCNERRPIMADSPLKSTHNDVQEFHTPKRRRVESEKPSQRETDELLTAVSIFLIYESLDEQQQGLIQHMIGAQDLLKVGIDGQSQARRASTTELRAAGGNVTKAWEASFWNFACVDYTSAHKERATPRLRIDDEKLWGAAGLPLHSVDGLYIPESLGSSEEPSDVEPMTETTALKTIIWLTLRTICCTSSIQGKHSSSGEASRPGPPAAVERQSIDRIEKLLDIWKAALPETFEPLRIPSPQQTEVFYSNNMGSVASILYHFTRILLLLHRPADPGNLQAYPNFVIERMHSYRRVTQQIQENAQDILAIASGKPSAAVRWHMLHPLFLTGLCIDSDQERARITDLFSAMGRDLGCSIEERLGTLQEIYN